MQRTRDAIALPPIMTVFEAKYRGDHQHEHGLLLDNFGRKVVEHGGDDDSVSFAPVELERACMGLLSHTHPRDLPPSGPDLGLAMQYGLTLRAVGNAPDTGQQFDHTIQMGAPDLQKANAIENAFDDAVQSAERNLVQIAHDQGWSDLQFERESRHLAVQRLASHFGFFYQRVQRHGMLSEATRHEQARIKTLMSVETTLRDEIFAPLHADLVRMLTRQANNNGIIPPGQIEVVRNSLDGLVQHTFLGSSGMNGALASYTVHRGQVIPRSPYFKILWGLMQRSAGSAIGYHAAIMRKYLPKSLITAYEMAVINPFEKTASEIDDKDIFPKYDSLHLWIGPDGKRLSDRIWSIAGDLRRRLDLYLTDAISSSKSVQQMAIELEDYLLPRMAQSRVETPFGDMSYPALRLARSEVNSAHNRADYLAGQRNPFVEKYNVVTSPLHNCSDICDEHEKNGPYEKSDPSHIPIFHPNCLCRIAWVLVSKPRQIVIGIQKQIEQAMVEARAGLTDFIGPLSKRFLGLLFGEKK